MVGSTQVPEGTKSTDGHRERCERNKSGERGDMSDKFNVSTMA